MSLVMESSVTFLPCRNLEQTREFYQDILGMKIFQQSGGNLIFDTNYGYLGFVHYDDVRPIDSGVLLYF